MSVLPTALERLVQGILPENPVYRQLLGLCPTLAVTNGLKPALTMAAAVGIVLLWSSFYLLGKILLAIPASFHDITIGQEESQSQ